MRHIVKDIHFVGIGGASMSGIAEVLLNSGYRVTDSDLGSSATMQCLTTLGAMIMRGHAPGHAIGANVVVVFTAVRGDNPEILAVHIKRIPIVPRAAMLAELMCLEQSVAIAGTHGKTATTSLVASVLAEGGLDPTLVIGDRFNPTGANARLDTGDLIVTKADGSGASFLSLFPVIEVTTNINANHMDTYKYDFVRLKQAFIEFTQQLPFYDIAVLCVGDLNMREVLPFVSKPVVRCGSTEDAQMCAVSVHVIDDRMEFIVIRQFNGHAEPPLSITLNLPGPHSVQNTLAAIIIVTELGASGEAITKTLAGFNDVNRCFRRYDGVSTADGKGRFALIDGYGHYPIKMAATLATACDAFPGRRLVLSFQPHRLTRTCDCFEGLIKVLRTIDALLLAEVYVADGPPIVAADSRALTCTLHMTNKIEPVPVEQTEDMPQAITDATQDGDVVITTGAGSTGQVPGQVVVLWAQAHTADIVDLNRGAVA